MVRSIILITAAVFLVTYVPVQLMPSAFGFRGVPLGTEYFGLIPFEVTHHLLVWQLATYLFLHGGWSHIVFNCLALWMFGYELERTWGSRRFLFYFFLTGIGAGLFNVLLDPAGGIPVIGNSGAVYGILLAYGVLFPDRPIFLYFVIPVKAKWFVLIMGLVEFWMSLTQPGSGVAHVAHLGGMLFGYLYLRRVRGTRGRGSGFDLRGQYAEWRRSRLRRKFEVYMQKHDPKDTDRWVN
ncbi:MAG TPA: rhomboid family intramembrane serine protease [Terriglobia bacterium]|nr:rhomboid family intramembrane serine protease [Terriglobia bacterium]